MPSFILRFLKLDRFEPNRIVTSNIVSVRTLTIIRAVELLYVVVALISSWTTAESVASYLKFFTNNCYLGLAGYLCASTLWGIFYLRVPESERATWIKGGSPWWGYTHWLFYSTVVTFSVIVPIVFWTLLASDMSGWTALDLYQNISVHAIDGVFGAVVELVLNRHFLQPIHSFFVAGVMVLYMCLTFIVHKTMGIWVYPFLDWDQGPKCAIYYIGIAVGLFLIFFILYFIHNFRNKRLSNRSIRINGDLDREYTQHHSEKDLEDGHRLETM